MNSNRAAGQDNIAPEYIKHGGPILLKWIYVLMIHIWTFAADLSSIDRLGCHSCISVQANMPLNNINL